MINSVSLLGFGNGKEKIVRIFTKDAKNVIHKSVGTLKESVAKSIVKGETKDAVCEKAVPLSYRLLHPDTTIKDAEKAFKIDVLA